MERRLVRVALTTFVAAALLTMNEGAPSTPLQGASISMIQDTLSTTLEGSSSTTPEGSSTTPEGSSTTPEGSSTTLQGASSTTPESSSSMTLQDASSTTQEGSSSTTPEGDSNTTPDIASCPVIVSRKDWGAKPPKEKDMITDLPVPFVILHHTYRPQFCNSSDDCKEAMRIMQHMHQIERGWFDIGYTFCVGGTGMVYEGRGWNVVGAHAPRYNNRSVGICFIGDYMEVLPTEAMMEVAKRLIQCGTDQGFIASNYTLIGHRQVRDTLCPGDKFYENITTWPHYKPIHDVQPYPLPTSQPTPTTHDVRAL